MKSRSNLTDIHNKKVVRIGSKNKNALTSSPNQKENIMTNALKSKALFCIEGKSSKQLINSKIKNKYNQNNSQKIQNEEDRPFYMETSRRQKKTAAHQKTQATLSQSLIILLLKQKEKARNIWKAVSLVNKFDNKKNFTIFMERLRVSQF